jgi:hypothetical protein
MVKNKGCGAHIAYAGLVIIALLLANVLQVSDGAYDKFNY